MPGSKEILYGNTEEGEALIVLQTLCNLNQPSCIHWVTLMQPQYFCIKTRNRMHSLSRAEFAEFCWLVMLLPMPLLLCLPNYCTVFLFLVSNAIYLKQFNWKEILANLENEEFHWFLVPLQAILLLHILSGCPWFYVIYFECKKREQCGK